MALKSGQRWGTVPALIDGDAQFSFAEVGELMMAVARSLIAQGVEPGDRVALWAPNSAAWVPAALGVQAAGAWLVPINTRLRGDEAAYILEKTSARLLLTVEEFLGTAYSAMLFSAAPELKAAIRVFNIPLPGTLSGGDWASFLASGNGVDNSLVERRINGLTPEDVSDVMFTSGTTSLPKGVLLRHGASLEGYRIFNRNFGLDTGSRFMVTTPFFHCFGYKAGWMMALDHGAVTLPVAVFDGESALQMVDKHGITHMGGTPTMYQAMMEHPERDRYDISSLTTGVVSATTVPERLVHRMRDEMGFSTALTGYGLTENHGFVSLTAPSDAPEVIATTAGKVIEEIAARVVDDDGNDVPAGEPGELWVKGFMVTEGYYEDSASTRAVITDGWLHTGDVVTLDADNYLKITDRKKDIYIMGGFNVAPAEVENVIGNIDNKKPISETDDY